MSRPGPGTFLGPPSSGQRVDALDIGILRELGVQPYGRSPRGSESLSPRRLAKTLGVTAETVRERVARMERERVIAGYALMPNVRHLGLSVHQYFLRGGPEASAEELVAKLDGFDGLLGVYTFLGGTSAVAFAHRGASDRERKLRLLRSLASPTEIVDFSEAEFPAPKRELSPLDWRLLRALRSDARRPLVEVAKDVGVSSRTVKRRYERMMSDGDFFVFPIVDPSRVPGLILFELVFEFAPNTPPAIATKVRKVLEDRLVCTDGTAGTPGACFGAGLYALGVGEVEDLRRRAAALAGVSKVETLVFASSVEEFDWLDEEIERRAAATPATP